MKLIQSGKLTDHILRAADLALISHAGPVSGLEPGVHWLIFGGGGVIFERPLA
jgi:hypothetical protein